MPRKEYRKFVIFIIIS